jgi:hypothetical protein
MIKGIAMKMLFISLRIANKYCTYDTKFVCDGAAGNLQETCRRTNCPLERGRIAPVE